MKRILCLVSVFLLIFAVAACGGKKKKDEKPAYEEQVTQEVSAEEGGTVKNSDESVSIEIPGDALDENTTITMRIYDAKGYVGTEGQKVVSKVVEFEPSGLVFKKPVIITMGATEVFENQVVTAAVYRESKGEWSYNEHGVYAVLAGRDAAGDPVMQTAAGDPIMLSAAGDPIMQSSGEGLSAAGDPIMLASAGDPIMTNAAGDPIMTSAAGDPIMMTTGHFTAYTFIVLGEPTEPVEEPDDDSDDADVPDVDEDEVTDEEIDEDEITDTEITDEEIPEEIEDEDETPDETEDEDAVVPEPPELLFSKVLCTGQIHCSNGNYLVECQKEGEDFYGQDAHFVAGSLCVPHKYSWGESYMNEETGRSYREVVDENTGLKWIMLGETATAENAKAMCEALTYGGHEWRLPTIKELLSISDHDRYSPTVNEFYFGDLDSAISNTPAPGEEEGTYWVRDYDGGTIPSDTDYGVEISCVTGEEYGKPGVFEVRNIGGKEVVVDSTTNLMWQKTSVSDKTWKEALKYCADLEYAGYSDWRLPNKNELITLVDYSKIDPASSFPEIVSEELWSSTFANSYGSGVEAAFFVYVGDGYVYNYDVSESLSARCVRSDTKPLPEGRTVPYCDGSRIGPCEDAATGRIWSTPDYAPEYRDLSWEDMAMRCRELNEGGISQWRIPTIDEIRELLPSSDKLKTGGECNITTACNNYYNEECFNEPSCVPEENEEEWIMSTLFDYAGYYISGTMSYQGNEDTEFQYSWAVNLRSGSIVSFGDDYGYSESRCIYDNSIPLLTFPYTDSDNHLVWSSLSKNSVRWYEAAKYCKELKQGGSNNWRIPTINELKTLVRNCPNGYCEPDMSGKYSVFGDIITLWSSEIDEYDYFHVFRFINITENSFPMVESYSSIPAKRIRCVRGENDPETVSEIEFPFDAGDLIWSKISDEELDSEDAAQYCSSLNEENYGGYDTWAVPTSAEVASLIKKSVCTNKSNFVSSNPSNGRCDIVTFEGYSIIGDMTRLVSNNAKFDFAEGSVTSTSYPYGFVRCVVRFD